VSIPWASEFPAWRLREQYSVPASPSIDELLTRQNACRGPWRRRSHLHPLRRSSAAPSRSDLGSRPKARTIPAINQGGRSTYAVSGDSTRINSPSYQIHRTPSGCGKQDDVPEGFLKSRNVDTSSRHDLRPVSLGYRTRRRLRLDAAAFDAVSPAKVSFRNMNGGLSRLPLTSRYWLQRSPRSRFNLLYLKSNETNQRLQPPRLPLRRLLPQEHLTYLSNPAQLRLHKVR